MGLYASVYGNIERLISDIEHVKEDFRLPRLQLMEAIICFDGETELGICISGLVMFLRR